jgi:hypothetical protein
MLRFVEVYVPPDDVKVVAVAPPVKFRTKTDEPVAVNVPPVWLKFPPRLTAMAPAPLLRLRIPPLIDRFPRIVSVLVRGRPPTNRNSLVPPPVLWMVKLP